MLADLTGGGFLEIDGVNNGSEVVNKLKLSAAG